MTKDYGFQAEDVLKLRDRKGRLNASQMGTGKTYMGADLDLETDTAGPTIVVSPLGNFDNWRGRFEERGVPFYEVDPKDRDGSLRRFLQARVPDGHKVFCIHWQALRLTPALATIGRERPWGHIIADEVHRMQGRKTQQTKALKAIRADFRTGLSGTPVTGNPAGYWSILNWLYPDIWKGFWKYYARYVNYEIVMPQGYHKVIGPKNVEELHELIDPYYIRHLKREPCCPHHPNGVMPWIPEKYYTTRWVELTSVQRRAYSAMEKDMLSWVGEHEDQPLSAGVVVAQMMRLQQLSMAYAEVTPEGIRLSEPSSKLDTVMEILDDNPTEQIVVFSQFSQACRLLAARLDRAGIAYGLYTGDTRSTRDEAKRAFSRGDLRVFLGTIAAGGEAIDGLQNNCSTMVFLDRTWSPAANQQAEDRLDRDGQTKPVQIIDIMARNTVDLGRRQKLETKWGWIRDLLGDKKGQIQLATNSDNS